MTATSGAISAADAPDGVRHLRADSLRKVVDGADAPSPQSGGAGAHLLEPHDIVEAPGEPVRSVERTRDEARAQRRQFAPEEVVDTTLDILGGPTPGELRDGLAVEAVTGRPPRTFADWARRHVALFRWNRRASHTSAVKVGQGDGHRAHPVTGRRFKQRPQLGFCPSVGSDMAGAAAVYPVGHPDAAPAAVATALTGATTTDRIGNPGTGTLNKLLKITE